MGALELRVSLTTSSAISRVGLIVPKFGHSAVERNRLKRRLRELTRLEILGALGASGPVMDVVMRALPSAYKASFRDLGSEIERLRARLIRSVQEFGAKRGADQRSEG